VRGLAQQLTINPNTVAKAYAELTAEGWLDARPASACSSHRRASACRKTNARAASTTPCALRRRRDRPGLPGRTPSLRRVADELAQLTPKKTAEAPMYAIETDPVPALQAQAALDHLTLALPRGGIHAIVGANGAGKSSLFRVLLGFATPCSGRARAGLRLRRA
jgi:ABC-type glutathione transport system ATPase component